MPKELTKIPMITLDDDSDDNDDVVDEVEELALREASSGRVEESGNVVFGDDDASVPPNEQNQSSSSSSRTVHMPQSFSSFNEIVMKLKLEVLHSSSMPVPLSASTPLFFRSKEQTSQCRARPQDSQQSRGTPIVSTLLPSLLNGVIPSPEQEPSEGHYDEFKASKHHKTDGGIEGSILIGNHVPIPYDLRPLSSAAASTQSPLVSPVRDDRSPHQVCQFPDGSAVSVIGSADSDTSNRNTSASGHRIQDRPTSTQTAVSYRCLFRRRCMELTGSVFETDSEEEMTVHLRSVHMNWLPFVCAICEAQLTTDNSLRLHFRTHHPEHRSPMMYMIEKNDHYCTKKSLSKEYLMECELSAAVSLTNQESVFSVRVHENAPLNSVKKETDDNSSRCSSETPARSLSRSPLGRKQGRACRLCLGDSGNTAITLFVSTEAKREHAEKHLIAEGRINLTTTTQHSDPVLLDVLKRCFGDGESVGVKNLRRRKLPEREREEPILNKFLKTRISAQEGIKKELDSNKGTAVVPTMKVTRSQAAINLMRGFGIRPCSVVITEEDRNAAEEVMAEERFRESSRSVATSVCRLCNKETTNQFSAHALTHIVIKKFNCGAQGCRYGSNKRKLVKKHLYTYHPGLNANSVVSKEREVGKLLEKKRKICFPDLVRPQKWELNTGIKKATATEEGKRKAAVCRKCGDSVSEGEFGEHVRRNHIRKFRCSYCKDFSSKLRISMQSHVQQRHPTHYYKWRYGRDEIEEGAVQEIVAQCFRGKGDQRLDGKKKMVCQLCGKSGSSPLKHVRLAHATRTFTCLGCGMHLDSKEKIDIHMVTTPGCLPVSGNGFKISQSIESQAEFCKRMEVCFPEYKMTLAEQANGIMIGGAQETTNRKRGSMSRRSFPKGSPWSCKGIFTKESNGGKKMCRLCRVVFSTRAAEKLHLLQSHMPQQYQCKAKGCKFGAGLEAVMKDHVSNNHGNEDACTGYVDYSQMKQSEILSRLGQKLLRDSMSDGYKRWLQSEERGIKRPDPKF